MTRPDEVDVDAVDRRRGVIATIAAAGVFGLLYLWFVYQAVGNLVNVPAAYQAVGFGDRIPWVLLILGLALPVLFYLGGLLLGPRLSITNRVLLFAAGLAASSATALSLYVVSAYLVSYS